MKAVLEDDGWIDPRLEFLITFPPMLTFEGSAPSFRATGMPPNVVHELLQRLLLTLM